MAVLAVVMEETEDAGPVIYAVICGARIVYVNAWEGICVHVSKCEETCIFRTFISF
jgi:hypothetical protein